MYAKVHGTHTSAHYEYSIVHIVPSHLTIFLCYLLIVDLSTYPPISLFTYLPTSLPVRPSIHQSTHPSVLSSIYSIPILIFILILIIFYSVPFIFTLLSSIFDRVNLNLARYKLINLLDLVLFYPI